MTFSQRAVEAAARAIAETRSAIYVSGSASANYDYDAAVAALTAALAVDGVALVPKEPTREMQHAGLHALDNHGVNYCTCDQNDVWSAMLSAASDGEERR